MREVSNTMLSQKPPQSDVVSTVVWVEQRLMDSDEATHAWLSDDGRPSSPAPKSEAVPGFSIAKSSRQ